MNLIYNGKEISEDKFNIGLSNRAFTYGDGIFETIIGSAERINFLSDHFERLSAGIKATGMLVPENFNISVWENNIKNLILKNKIEGNARIKIVVWRKSGGLFTPANNQSEYIITAIPHEAKAVIHNKVLFYKDVRLSYSPFSKFKTLSSLPYIMAGIAKQNLQADDVVLFDAHDNIGECLASNIFWIKENKVFTPSITTGCKEGIMRKQIINFLNKNNISFEEGKFKQESLLSADFAFSSNVVGVIPIRQIEERTYQTNSDIEGALMSFCKKLVS